MGSNRTAAFKLIGLMVLVPVVIATVFTAIIGVRTMNPLTAARGSLDELEQNLGESARYTPLESGAIPALRMEAFLEIRNSLVLACEEYGPVQRAFETVDSLDPDSGAGWEETGSLVKVLAGATFEITPFLARYFELRNDALLYVNMGLEEYSYIYAMAYHDELLSDHTRDQIFSNGDALSEEASAMLADCIRRQLSTMDPTDPRRPEIQQELARMDSDPWRLAWQDGLSASIGGSIDPYRDRLGDLFCSATAGLEMERGARRAIWLALE